MFKRALINFLLFILTLTVLQWLFRPEIRWGENIVLTSIALFIFFSVESLIKLYKKAKK